MATIATNKNTDYQANVSLWLNCNLKCAYCFGNPRKIPKQWPDDLENRLDQLLAFLNRTGTWTLTMSGGEVTIYPGFANLCTRLHQAGHRVEFFTNGVRRLADVFPGNSIQAVSRVAFSYQTASEKAPKLDVIFDENIAFLRDNSVEVDVNYVMYPDRRHHPHDLKERFLAQGADFRFLTFQGEYQKKQYPFAYTDEDRRDFFQYGDLRAAFLMEHGYYQPTFKQCRAGFETFYICLRTGGVYPCEQLQQKKLADFAHPEGVAQFQTQVADRPTVCPARRCTCRLTVEQEQFLAEHDDWDLDLYPEWEKLCLPNDRAIHHWLTLESTIAREITARLGTGSLFLWGGGVHTLMLLKFLQKQGFPLDRARGIIDSNSLKQGEEILGLPIVSRARFEAEGAAGCTDILVSSRAFEEEISADITRLYGTRFNVIRLYDGSLTHDLEAIECTV